MPRALSLLLPAASLALLTCAKPAPHFAPYCPTGDDLAAEVNPMIGTRGPGNVVPGALVPHGLVKLSPDTNAPANSIDAYEYDDDRIQGFSHTHLEGPGGSLNGYSQLLLLPTTGPLKVLEADYASRYSHATEQASPGSYAVTLDDYGVRAELTASAHAGFHRYTFPASADSRVLLDLGHSRGGSLGGEVQLVDDHTVQGYGQYSVHPLLDLLLTTKTESTAHSTVYFQAVFSKPFESVGTWKKTSAGTTPAPGSRHESGPSIGAWVGFATAAGEVVEVRVGVSLVSVEQAQKNLDAEWGQKSFDELRDQARAAWNCQLNRVQLTGGTPEQRTTFYTALYHTTMQPTDVTEVGGVFFSGADGQGATFTWKDQRYYTDDWCAWDTFRTSRPWATLIEPEVVNDVVASYLHQYTQGGWLQKCPWIATGNSRIMTANPEVAILADAVVKGFGTADPKTLWAAVQKSATAEDPKSLLDGACGYLNVGTPPEYVRKGYVSHECDTTQSASMTLEYAYDDWCTAQVALALGQKDDAAPFLARAGNYRNVWNPEHGFMQGKARDGTWVEPFDPAKENQDFTEATSWIYTWFVPHDVPGLVTLMGGQDAFVTKLDEFFAGHHFDPSNEPDFHAPFLYNLVGRPAQTQARVRALLASSYSAAPDGLVGNDDAGAMSAWYVLSALGLYPVTPGDGKYQLTSPLFDRATLRLNPAYPGSTFVIEARDNSADNVYVQSATLNGKPLTRAWLTHQEVVAGGTLSFTLGPAPSAWGR